MPLPSSMVRNTRDEILSLTRLARVKIAADSVAAAIGDAADTTAAITAGKLLSKQPGFENEAATNRSGNTKLMR